MISPTLSPQPADGEQINARARSEFGPVLLISVCYMIVGFKFFAFINRYSVNLFFWDHWDFENGPLFEHHSLWEVFRWQHGPHRQGFGGLLSALIDPLFHWSSRAQSFEAGILVLLASFCALWLKRRLWGRLEYFDAAIPLLFLVRNQAESFIAGANISHGPVPLFLILIYCLAWTVNNLRWKYSLVVALNFFLIYTGFGIFIGIVTPLLLTIQMFRKEADNAERIYCLVALIGAAASLASFFTGYHFDPAVDCFSTRPHHPLPYLWFVHLMFANFAGIKGMGLVPTFFGSMIGLAILTSFALAVSNLVAQRIENRTRALVIAALSGYALLFCANTAVGRICLGVDAGQAPRYVVYLITGFLALYLSCLAIRNETRRNVAVCIFLAFAAWCGLHLNSADWLTARNRAYDQRAWRECYLKRESVKVCDALSNTKIYPWPEATHLQEKLQFLKQKHLNLYSDQR